MPVSKEITKYCCTTSASNVSQLQGVCCTTSASGINSVTGTCYGLQISKLYLQKSNVRESVQRDYQSQVIWTTSPILYGLPVQDFVEYQAEILWTTSPKNGIAGLLFCEETVGRNLAQMDY